MLINKTTVYSQLYLDLILIDEIDIRFNYGCLCIVMCLRQKVICLFVVSNYSKSKRKSVFSAIIFRMGDSTLPASNASH